MLYIVISNNSCRQCLEIAPIGGQELFSAIPGHPAHEQQGEKNKQSCTSHYILRQRIQNPLICSIPHLYFNLKSVILTTKTQLFYKCILDAAMINYKLKQKENVGKLSDRITPNAQNYEG